MTRTEELERKRERNRREYEARLEKQRIRSREKYWENRDFILAKAAVRRQQLREAAVITYKPAKPSMESLEAQLPYPLCNRTKELRKEFLKIPILQRPPYDEFLKLKAEKYNGTEQSRL